MSARLRAFASVFAASALCFLFVAAGALSTWRLLGVAFALPFGMLVGAAERRFLPAAPSGYAVRSGLAFVGWAAASGLALALLLPRLAGLDGWGTLLLLAFVAGLAGAFVSAAMQTRPPLGLRYFGTMLLARVLAALAAVAVYRAGHLYGAVFAGAAAYAAAFTLLAARPR